MEQQIDHEYYKKRRQQILNNIEHNNSDFLKIVDENLKIYNNQFNKKDYEEKEEKKEEKK